MTSSEVTLSFVALLDVLGYKNRLLEDQTSGTYTFKNTLERAFLNCPNVNETEYSLLAISDTLIITCTKRENFVNYLEILKEIELAFLKEGIFLRGGVSYGHHFKSGNITYSHAVARAHDMEATTAQNPRIVIDYNIINLFKSLDKFDQICQSGLLCEENGVYSLNIINSENWLNIYQYAKNMFEHEQEIINNSIKDGKQDKLFKNQSIFSKHTWFENYIFSSSKRNMECDRYIPRINFFD